MANSARIDELQRRFAENPRRYFAPLANEYRKNGNLEQAILICQEYLPQQPGHMSGHIVYGQTLYEAGRFAEARAVFETALALDPENLIALHHLGHIARELGDIDAARSWYRRVLETDPRNDEIIQLLAQLESTSAAAIQAPSALADAATPSENATAPNATEYERTSAASIATPPAGSEEVLGFEPTSVSSPEPMEGASADPSESEAAHIEQPPVATPTDNETFELVPVEAATDGDAPEELSSDAPDAEAASWSEPPEAESSPEEEIALTTEASVAPSSASQADALDAELFGDDDDISPTDDEPVGVELSTDHAEGAPAEIEREEDIFETPPRSADVSRLVDVESTAAASADERTVERPFTSSMDVETSPVDGGHDGRETPPAPEDVFVTETMADLYLRQGHLESALDIFRRLVAQRPADGRLRDRLRDLEELLFGATVEMEAPVVATPTSSPTAPAAESVEPAAVEPRASHTEVESVPADSGAEADIAAPAEPTLESAPVPAETPPTIREFLTGILARRSARPTTATPEGSDVQASNDAVLFEGSAPKATPEIPVTEVSAQEPANQQSREALETIFDEGAASDANISAATVLAEAFSDNEIAAAPLEGVPAHRAPNELSLDHVFRTPGKGVDSGAFSFDRFFSEESKDKKPSPAPEPPENSTGAIDDIAQFNAWLSGLKKT